MDIAFLVQRTEKRTIANKFAYKTCLIWMSSISAPYVQMLHTLNMGWFNECMWTNHERNGARQFYRLSVIWCKPCSCSGCAYTIGRHFGDNFYAAFPLQRKDPYKKTGWIKVVRRGRNCRGRHFLSIAPNILLYSQTYRKAFPKKF